MYSYSIHYQTALSRRTFGDPGGCIFSLDEVISKPIPRIDTIINIDVSMRVILPALGNARLIFLTKNFIYNYEHGFLAITS